MKHYAAVENKVLPSWIEREAVELFLLRLLANQAKQEYEIVKQHAVFYERTFSGEPHQVAEFDDRVVYPLDALS